MKLPSQAIILAITLALAAGQALGAPRKAVQGVLGVTRTHTAAHLQKPVEPVLGSGNASWFSTPLSLFDDVGFYLGGKFVRNNPNHYRKSEPSRLGLKSSSISSNSGIASWYASGTRTASGAHYNPDGVSCAHRTAKFGTHLTVTDLDSGRSIVCVVNDRGPFVKGRIVDLSRGAARQLGILGKGLAHVSISY